MHNDAYLVQVEGWRGAVRQEEMPAPASRPVPAQVLPPIVKMAVKVIERVGRPQAA